MDHLVVVSVLIRLIQRDIIFINEKNYLLVIVLTEKIGQCLQTAGQNIFFHGKQGSFLGIYPCQQGVLLLVRVRKLFAFQKKMKTQRLLSDDNTQHGEGLFKVHAFHALERYGNHREFPHVFFTEFRFFGHGEPIEEIRVAVIREEIFEHVHIQGLAEPSGTCEKIHFAPAV